MPNSPNLQTLRTQIDQIDQQILTLFAERMEIAKQIGKTKHQSNQPIHAPTRETTIFANAKKHVPPELIPDANVLLQVLIEAAKRVQTNNL